MRDPLHELDKDQPAVGSEERSSPAGQESLLQAPDQPQDSSTPNRTQSEPATAHVAVVFVHGMGTSKPGDMLEGYMNPSLEWIKRATTDDHNWYKRNDLNVNLVEGVNILERDRQQGTSPITSSIAGAPATQSVMSEVDIAAVPRALLHSTAHAPAIFQPSYIEVDLTSIQPASREKKKLVAVEAWWDGEFDPPPFRLVANWALGVAPSLILRHLALVWERDPGWDEHTLSVSQMSFRKPPSLRASLGKLLNALLFTVVGGVIAILFQWAICLLLAVGFVPFLQKYASAIILKMTTSFGDVLTYVHDGVRSAAIRSTVMRTFLWLHTNYAVEKLVVIGHSLGSVIAYDVLNSRDLLPTVAGKDVSFVTFGSPLKKANLLLQLRRDEQRTSLGTGFACFSLLCAVGALIAGVSNTLFPDTGPLSRGQWRFIAFTGISAVALGLGAHSRPRHVGAGHGGPGLTLSLFQYLGLFLAMVAALILLLNITTSWFPMLWRIVAALVIIGLVRWAIRVSSSRRDVCQDPYRISQFLGFGILLLALVAAAGLSAFLHPVACFLLAALIFSVMTGANPLEEFAPENGCYVRQMPKFSFAIPIRKWIDFWATNDLVSEFGLGDSRYSPTLSGEAKEIPVSRRVTNMRSFIVDHTSYRHNLEQFIAPLTRLFLEELSFRSPDSASGRDLGVVKSFLGYTPIRGIYEQDVTNTMRSRASRIRWLSWASTLLLVSMLLLSPSVYRSIGEYMVFDEPSIVINKSPDEPAQGPGWFKAFYSEKARPSEHCEPTLRHLPFVPKDVSKNIVCSTVTGNLILHSLGYGLVFALASLLTRAFLLTPWKSWESAILDALLQKNTSFGFNRLVRAGLFLTFALATVALATWIHLGRWSDWAGSAWIWNQDLSPAQTIVRFINWLLPPGINIPI